MKKLANVIGTDKISIPYEEVSISDLGRDPSKIINQLSVSGDRIIVNKYKNNIAAILTILEMNIIDGVWTKFPELFEQEAKMQNRFCSDKKVRLYEYDAEEIKMGVERALELLSDLDIERSLRFKKEELNISLVEVRFGDSEPILLPSDIAAKWLIRLHEILIEQLNLLLGYM